MNIERLLELVDELSAELITAETSDDDSLSRSLSIAEQLEKEMESAEGAEPKIEQDIASCKGVLDKTVHDKDNVSDEEFQSLLPLLTSIQRGLKEASMEKKKSVSPVPSKGTSFDAGPERLELPEYVDQEVFREFLSNFGHVLEEIEEDVLLLEKGDAAAKADLKRKIHTLKGEAGVLSLGDIETVCHAVEDLLAENRPLRTVVDLLLETVDWMGRAGKRYADFQFPEPRGSAYVECLRARTSVVTDVPSGAESSVDTTAPSGEAKTPAESKEESDAKDSAGMRETSDEIEIFDESWVEEHALDDAVATSSEFPSNEAADGSAEASAARDKDDIFLVDWDEEAILLVGEFLEESEEGLSHADQILMNIDHSGMEPEKVNALFRTFHTIKGVSGFLELAEITRLAHTTETMLDQVREGKFPLEGAVLDLVFDSTELMRGMLKSVRSAVENGGKIHKEPNLAAQIQKLEELIKREQPPSSDSIPSASRGEKLGEILIKSNIPPSVINSALERQKVSRRPLGEELVAGGELKPKEVSRALRAQRVASDPSGVKIKETVKVDLERVDRLVEMIGELVIVESMVVHADEISSLASPKVRTYLSQLEKITRDLQDTGMRMRMVPVRGVFQKMARMVRDLARKSRKSVRMTTVGEGTEMDRSMVEQITDPLVHMIRNAVDHAIESVEERKTLGKPPEGEIRLSAYHEGGSIVIEITDDGKGLDRDAIIEKALRQGVLAGEEQLTDAEVFKLIFAPGFSTAAKVTEISGRGVGMDVVKRNIESLRGRIAIESEKGKGTTFKLILPLTLAIIDGMLVSCGPDKYIVPTLSIVESLQVTESMVNSFAEKGELVNVRGDIFPLLRMDRLFGIEGAKTEPSEGLVVVIEGVGHKVGLFVDDVLTQQQVVIKSLGNGIRETPYISGGAIMSDGTVGLIVNVEEIAAVVDKRTNKNLDYSAGSSSGGWGAEKDLLSQELAIPEAPKTSAEEASL